MDAARDWVRVSGTPVAASSWTIRSRRMQVALITVAFIPNLTQFRDHVLYIRYVRRRLAHNWKNIPTHPNNTNPTTRDSPDLSEASVTTRSNDGRDELRNTERAHGCCRGPLHEEEAVKTRDEDQGL